MLEKEVQTHALKEVVNTEWRKEAELKELKMELDSLKRKIHAEITLSSEKVDEG